MPIDDLPIPPSNLNINDLPAPPSKREPNIRDPRSKNIGEKTMYTGLGAASSFLGQLGDIQESMGKVIPTQKYGPQLPRTEQIEKFALAGNAPSKEQQKYMRGGEILGSFLAPSIGVTKGIAKKLPEAAETAGRLMPGAMEKGLSKLEEIAKPTDISQLGSSMESALNNALSIVQKSRSEEYAKLMAKAEQEVAGKEPRIVDTVNKYIKNQLIGKSKDLNDAEQKLLIETANNIRGKSLVGIDKEIRRLKDIAEETSMAPGYSSVRSRKAGEIAKELEKAIEPASKTYRQAKDLYKSASEPVNIYEHSVGRQLLEGSKDPASLPKQFFKTEYTVNNLRTLVGEENAVKFAKNHIANELSAETTAKGARAWMNKNDVWLKTFPKEKQAADTYVKNLEAIEKTRGRAKAVGIAGAGLVGATAGYNQLKKLLGIF